MLKVYQLRLNQNTFEVTLKYRGVGVRVAFVDGNTYNGVPAKCYTNDPFKQRAIEASQMFKNKEIVLERSLEEESDRKKADVKVQEAAKPKAAPAEKKYPEPAVATDEQKETDGDGLKPMTFENLGEAILYIVNEWQVGVQTEKDAREILKAHGIKPTIKKG